MELFKGMKAVRLRGPHNKFLVADEDEEGVTQGCDGSSHAARWTVELVDRNRIRLKSCYERYLTASNETFLFVMTGRKVLQTNPHHLNSSTEWEPVREGFQVKLKTMHGHFLRANGGLWPWRNSVTHHIPQSTHDILWDLLWDVAIHVPESIESQYLSSSFKGETAACLNAKPTVVLAYTPPPVVADRRMSKREMLFLILLFAMFVLWGHHFLARRSI